MYKVSPGRAGSAAVKLSVILQLNMFRATGAGNVKYLLSFLNTDKTHLLDGCRLRRQGSNSSSGSGMMFSKPHSET